MKVTILGATGSIGLSTLDVLARHPDRFDIFALTGNSRVTLLAEQCRVYNPAYAVVTNSDAAATLIELLAATSCRTEVLCGEQSLCDVCAAPEVDAVMAAIVGSAGLLPTLAAAKAGKRVLLANKESLVMAGDLLMSAVAASGALLLPIDSEHNAIFQCLPDSHGQPRRDGVKKILLSASGGPFRDTPVDDLAAVTPEQACAHPNWEMGRKISVDSATMMNKGLELIEACHLFSVTPDQVEVVIHPESVVHSMVEYVDGSVLAQLGNPDMRTPIAYGLAWPERITSGVSPLDITAIAQLNFAAPDLLRFPCLALAIEAARAGGDRPVVLNAANEVAVAAFLERRIGFVEIAAVVEEALNCRAATEPDSLEAVQSVDLEARRLASDLILQQVS